MLYYFKKISLFLSTVFVLTAIFFSFAQASFLDMIRAWVTINPLEVNVSAPGEVEIDKAFQVEAKVINKGEEKIENVKGEIILPEGLALLKKDPAKELGVIPGKREKKISWQVQGKKIGNYVILVLVSGELKGDIVSAQGSTLVKIGEPLPRGRGRGWFQNLFDFLRERLNF